MVGLCILVASTGTKGISIPFAAGFLVWYVIFIILVAIEDVREKRENTRKAKAAVAGLEEDLIEDENGEKHERKKSIWEEDDEREEKAKQAYLKDLMRQKTNTAINFEDDGLTESEFDAESSSSDEEKQMKSSKKATPKKSAEKKGKGEKEDMDTSGVVYGNEGEDDDEKEKGDEGESDESDHIEKLPPGAETRIVGEGVDINTISEGHFGSGSIHKADIDEQAPDEVLQKKPARLRRAATKI